jgi:glutathione S-transferase
MSQYKLYGRQGSGSYAVQVVLEEIGAPYSQVWISKDEADVSKLREVNGTGKVPALGLPDGTLIIESAAMLVHLTLAYPAARLAPPPGSSQHALFLQWMTFLSANVYEAVLRAYYATRFSTRGDADADAEAIAAQGTKDIASHLEFLSQSMGPYVLGREYSVVDPYLYMLASWYPPGVAELHARIPALAAHAALMQRRPAIIKVEAEHAA